MKTILAGLGVGFLLMAVWFLVINQPLTSIANGVIALIIQKEFWQHE